MTQMYTQKCRGGILWTLDSGSALFIESCLHEPGWVHGFMWVHVLLNQRDEHSYSGMGQLTWEWLGQQMKVGSWLSTQQPRRSPLILQNCKKWEVEQQIWLWSVMSSLSYVGEFKQVCVFLDMQDKPSPLNHAPICDSNTTPCFDMVKNSPEW